MKLSLLNPSSFLPEGVAEWAKEKGYNIIDSVDQLAGQEDQQCFLGFRDSIGINENLHQNSPEAQGIGAFDGIDIRGGVFWPRVHIKIDLQKLLSLNGWSLSRQHNCFLLGDDVTLRWMLSFALQMGFRNIVVFGTEPAWSKSFARPSTNITWMPTHKIPQMDKQGSFLLSHCEKCPIDYALLEEVKYLHFLDDDSHFIDLSRVPFLEAAFLPKKQCLNSVDAWKEMLSMRWEFSSKV
ncbi:MAG: hypothetical protein V4736_05865 [Bdellovibrionota bacterium]